MDPAIFLANYQQQPIDIIGRLYSNIKTYKDIPLDAKGNPAFSRIRAYVDTADLGKDFLCSIIYGVYNRTQAYILDVYYSKKGMEVTEPETASRLIEHRVGTAVVESNNGGRGFARAVRKEIVAQGSTRPVVRWFHQSNNKIARINSHSNYVQQHIYFPENWAIRWPDFFRAMMDYNKEGGNDYDDGPDAITGVAEYLIKSSGSRAGPALF